MDVNTDRNQVLLYIYLPLGAAHPPPCSSALVRISSSDKCEKLRKSIKEKQPISANPCSLGWDDFLSGPFYAANEHCSKERRENVARARKVSIFTFLMSEEMRNVVLAF